MMVKDLNSFALHVICAKNQHLKARATEPIMAIMKGLAKIRQTILLAPLV
jgi:hypothetical protein